MLFNSFHFLCFFPVVLLLYYLLPWRNRWMLLLAASYYFYGSWNWWYLGLILVSTAVDFFAAQRIEASDSPTVRKRFLALSIASNLGILFAFKYFNFFIDSASTLLANANVAVPDIALQVLLPVGISFYTFQTMSYTIDVYRGKIPAERHAGHFALFVAFWPQLVAGPIERAERLLPQFKRKPDLQAGAVLSGINRMVYGFFKKVVIADRLALYVDPVFADPGSAPGVQVALAACFFLIQVYCDFSGYSDIAVGAARMLGYDLVINFERPFLATSFREYWRRWHISLTNWVRDYIYIPLGGNRVSAPRWVLNSFLAFGLMGLWHGASWTFVIWGLLHAFLLVAEHYSTGISARIPIALRKIGGWLLVMGGFAVSMVFFRANSLADAVIAFEQIAGINDVPGMHVLKGALTMNQLLLCFALIGVLFASYTLPRNFRFRFPLLYLAVALLLILLLGVDEKLAFVYFQF